MNQSDVDPVYFVFRNVLRGLFWTAMGGLIATWIIVFVFFVNGFVTTNNEHINLLDAVGGVLYILFETTIFSIMGFVVLGIPVMILPCTISILVLTVWLYRDAKAEKISFKGARIKGLILGALAGMASLFVPMKFFLWPYVWMGFINQKERFILFWVILLILPLTGSITGRYLGGLLAREFEPKGDDFSIDWDALQKEEQQKNLTPDTSTHDT